jgi:hypothetical protein
MHIDWANFTPLLSLTGGLIIGVAASIFILVNGRVAGISGIVGGLLRSTTGDSTWRLAFVLGLVSAPLVYELFAVLPAARIDAHWPVLVVAGLLVGLGTQYASGCTSGHGVCGVSRLSPRSLGATLVFVTTGIVTVYLVRFLLGG